MILARKLKCTHLLNGVFDECLSETQISQLDAQMRNTYFTMNAASSEKTTKYSEVMAEYSAADFKNHFLFEVIGNAFQMLGFSHEECQLHQVMANCNRFGDYAFAHIDMPSSDYYSVLVYGNSKWNIEWGGETYFCNENKEIEECLIPKPGRIAIFPSHMWHIAGVPCATYRKFRYTISARYKVHITS